MSPYGRHECSSEHRHKDVYSIQKINLYWESSGKVKILNDKNKVTRVPSQATQQANCLDLSIITPGLYETGIKFTLVDKREWTPAQVAFTGIRESNGDKIFLKKTVSDHMAIEAEIKANITCPEDQVISLR